MASATVDSLTIPSRFNGPPRSANGGYSCGRLARFFDGDTAVEVTLRKPPPLDFKLQVVFSDDRLELREPAGDLVAEAVTATFVFEPPLPPSFEEIEAVHNSGEQFCREHTLATCFVCGVERKLPDGLRLFAGKLPGRDLWSATWRPSESLATRMSEDLVTRPSDSLAAGNAEIPTEVVWAALDCPTYPASIGDAEPTPALLGRLTAQQYMPVYAGVDYRIVAWPIERQGRKRHAAAAIWSPKQELVAASRALWIAIKPND